MDVELTPERHERLAEAGYVPAPALGSVPVRGRIRVQDAAGAPFDLELVDLPDGAREAAIAHLSGWFSVADPGVEPLVDALDLDDAVGYLTAVAQPCTLETFVEVTGRLGAGHTSTLVVTLGRTLARLHARGLRYGPIRPQDVLIDAGRVLLTVPKPAPTGATPLEPSPQEDAYHLAALADAVIAPAHGAQAGDRPEPGLRGLTKLIVSALGDADTRPGVGTLATLSHDLAPCLPLVPLVPLRAGTRGADAVGAPGEHGVRGDLDRPPPRRKAFRGSTSRREATDDAGLGDPHAPLRSMGAARAVPGVAHRRVRSLTLVVVAAVLAGVVGGGVVVHRLGAAGPAQAAPIEEKPAGVSLAGGAVDGDPGAAAARLTAARMDAVVALTNAPEVAAAGPSTEGSAGAVPDSWADVLVPDSPAHVQAAELVSSLRADGARISGLAVEIKEVVVLAQAAASASSPATAQVQVTFSVGAYTVESPAGSQMIPAGAPRTAVLELVATDAGWRVATAQELAPPP